MKDVLVDKTYWILVKAENIEQAYNKVDAVFNRLYKMCKVEYPAFKEFGTTGSQNNLNSFIVRDLESRLTAVSARLDVYLDNIFRNKNIIYEFSKAVKTYNLDALTDIVDDIQENIRKVVQFKKAYGSFCTLMPFFNLESLDWSIPDDKEGWFAVEIRGRYYED